VASWSIHFSVVPRNSYFVPSAVTVMFRSPSQPAAFVGFAAWTPVTSSSGMTVTSSPPAAAFLATRLLVRASPAHPPTSDVTEMPSHPMVWNSGMVMARKRAGPAR
jgi:hypothetical protein